MSAIFVFSPVLASDTEEAADALAAELADPRATFIWDPSREVGYALARTLGGGGADFAWDVYCLYAPGTDWTSEDPPAPARWAHQLEGGPPEHDFRGRIGVAVEAWVRELSGQESPSAVDAAPRPSPPPQRTLTFRAEDVRPLPEALLQGVLSSWQETGAESLDAATRARIAADLLRRMRDACVGYEEDVPRAIYHEGRILIVRGGSCRPGPSEEGPSDRR